MLVFLVTRALNDSFIFFFPLLGAVWQLLLSISERCDVTFESKTITLLLGSYTASLSARDVTTLKLLQSYERKVTLHQYRPFFWGAKAREYYVNMATASMWKTANADQVLECVDQERMLRSAIKLPLNIDLQVRYFHYECLP